jgi:hypothetical protein
MLALPRACCVVQATLFCFSITIGFLTSQIASERRVDKARARVGWGLMISVGNGAHLALRHKLHQAQRDRLRAVFLFGERPLSRRDPVG